MGLFGAVLQVTDGSAAGRWATWPASRPAARRNTVAGSSFASCPFSENRRILLVHRQGQGGDGTAEVVVSDAAITGPGNQPRGRFFCLGDDPNAPAFNTSATLSSKTS